MKINRLVAFTCGCLTVSMMAATVSADDTEIFFNINETAIRPNLLFVLDNSGSMDAKVVTTIPYDPAVTYTGDMSDDYIYFDGGRWIRSIRKSELTCDDVLPALERSGYLTEYRMAYWDEGWGWWDSGEWEELDNSDIDSRTDCEVDDDIDVNWWNYNRKDIYSANYLNWYYDHRIESEKTRMEIVQEVAIGLADSLTQINIGLMSFRPDSVSEGGRVLIPVENVADNRTAFKAAVAGLSPDTNTPLSETLFGAMRYYSGGKPFLDTNPVASTVDGNGNYISPVEYQCQSNNIVFLTDGDPTQDTNHEDTMEGVVGNCSGNCMNEIAAHMQTNDLIPSRLSDDQTVNTYTVGFQSDQQLLADTASEGSGEYYLANDAEQLKSAFQEIVRSVLAVNSTFVAPGVAVDSFDRLNHLDTLYFSVFQPDLSPRWDGNLKRYRLGADGTIYDLNDVEAVDPSTGFFKTGARSWWSEASDPPDGPVVSMGGAAAQQPDENVNRKVFTQIGSSYSLTDPSNAVVPGNSNLTKAMFGDEAMTDTELQHLINWTRGLDVEDVDGDGDTTDARKFIADPLHSVPQVVIYTPDTDPSDGTEADATIFFGDNQGFIHAVDGIDGDTYFSFIPTELLANQPALLNNDKGLADRVYGMDGSIIVWKNDENDDGKVVAASGDRVYIYSGMRRGGRSYYALDVTDRDAPKSLWSITGGIGKFAELGQTWSKPVKTKVMIGTEIQEVIIFAGGYDADQDNVAVRAPDDVGRALYFVEASSGELLWSAGPEASSTAELKLAEMDYSIPAAPKVLDVNGDGLADQIYVGDMGGQVWRFDIANGNTASTLVTGGVIANLAGDTEAENRRFYHSPDLFGLNVDGVSYLGLVIGSGWQAHPLNTVIEDRIYMLRIANVGGPPVDANGVATYEAVDESELFDTTLNLIGEGTTAQINQAVEDLAGKKGWYIRLTNVGEKVLSSSLTLAGQTFITTYEPKSSNDSCLPGSGIARLYHINTKDGTPVVNYDDVGTSEDLTKTDRAVVLNMVGLPPDPRRVRVDGADIICVGVSCQQVQGISGITETYWYEQ